MELRTNHDAADAAEVVAPADESNGTPPPLPERAPDQVHAYHRAKRAVHLGGIALSLAYWIAWVAVAEGYVAWLGGLTDARWAGLVLAALTMAGGMVLVSLPLDYYSGYILEKRFDLTNQSPRDWAVFQLKGLLVGWVIGGIVLAGLYAALWYGGVLWSVWVGLGLLIFSVGLAKLFPVLILPIFYPSKPLDRPSLTERLIELASGSGMTLTGVYNLELSRETKKANAMLAGLGSSRRVYLSDTLLESCDDDEIAVVFAHELGHHVRGHIWKGIGMSTVIIALMVALIHWRLNPYAGDAAAWVGAVAGLAEVMLLLSIVPLFTGPVTNAIMRRFERQCDGDALRLTRDPGAFRRAFDKLTRLNLADPNPPRWEVILFDDHPPIAERLAMAEAWSRENRTGA